MINRQGLRVVYPDAIWALDWTAKNEIITGSADGHLRIHSAETIDTSPLHDLALHPLAISSLSTSGDGSRVLSASLDGTVSLVDTAEGKEIGRLDTGREKVGEDSIGECGVEVHPPKMLGGRRAQARKV